MDRNDLVRKVTKLKAELQPKLDHWHKISNEAKDKDGNDRQFTAEEWEKHEMLSKEISDINAQLLAHQAAIAASDACDRADEADARKLGLSNVSQLPNASDEYRESFMNSMRNGLRDGSECLKLLGGRFENLTGTSPSTGAVLIPTELERTILMEAAAESPLLSMSGTITVAGRLNAIPFISSIGVLAPRSEGEEYVRTEPTLLAKNLNIYNFGGMFPISMELMEDAPELNAAFGGLAADALAETVEEYGLKGVNGRVSFTNQAGSGVTLSLAGKVPTGILNFGTGVVPVHTSASTTVVSTSDIFNTMQKVKSAAKRRGEWLISKGMETSFMVLSDSTGRPLWMPSLAAGSPATFGGANYQVSDRLATPGAGATVGIFGDFKRGHRIALRKGMTVKRSEHFYFGNNMLAVAMDLRFGSTVLFNEYLAKLNMAAS